MESKAAAVGCLSPGRLCCHGTGLGSLQMLSAFHLRSRKAVPWLSHACLGQVPGWRKLQINNN